MSELKNSKTEENLKAAFAGESQANRRYLYFAQKADIEGYNDKKNQIGAELGDVLWYCAMLAKEVDMNLGSIMEGNLDKLADRKARNRLQGDGDNR